MNPEVLQAYTQRGVGQRSCEVESRGGRSKSPSENMALLHIREGNLLASKVQPVDVPPFYVAKNKSIRCFVNVFCSPLGAMNLTQLLLPSYL
mmetsp:Transcript_32552/g.74897  ORF Transcript_32552/g.74897 Transcript_32552/m.74897 type:complete len:92 (+) Transcript_32552:671-946(+)